MVPEPQVQDQAGGSRKRSARFERWWAELPSACSRAGARQGRAAVHRQAGAASTGHVSAAVPAHAPPAPSGRPRAPTQWLLVVI